MRKIFANTALIALCAGLMSPAAYYATTLNDNPYSNVSQGEEIQRDETTSRTSPQTATKALPEVPKLDIKLGPESALDPLSPINTDPYDFSESTTSPAQTYISASMDAWTNRHLAYQNTKLAEQAEEKHAELDAAHQEAVEYAAEMLEQAQKSAVAAMEMYKYAGQTDVSVLGPSLSAVLHGSGDEYDAFIARINAMENTEQAMNAISNKAVEDSEKAEAAEAEAQELAAEAEAKKQEAEAKKTQAKQASQASEDARANAEAAWKDSLTEINENNYAQIFLEDGDTNHAPSPATVLPINIAIDEWNQYLNTLREEGIIPPMLESLKTEDLIKQQGWTPAYTANGTIETGIAYSQKGTLILPSESIQRVNDALSSMLTPFDIKSTLGDPTTYSCQTFIADVVGLDETTPFDTLYESYAQTTNVQDSHPGDIIMLGDSISGVHQAGVNIGGGFIAVASASTGVISIEEIGYDALIAVRPGLPVEEDKMKAPQPSETSAGWECGGIPQTDDGTTASSATSSQVVEWLTPFKSNDNIVTSYGEEDASRFASWEGKSYGIEYSAGEENQVVRAATNGIVTKVFEDDEELGNAVAVKFSDLLTITYNGLEKVAVSEGASVQSGDALGIAGTTGSVMQNSQSGVMIEVTTNGTRMDPETLFNPVKESFSEYANGRIPADALCAVGTGGHRLRCDAARAFNALAAAYEADMGKPIMFTDTYRSYEAQVICKQQKPTTCAVPGTSNHGWGLAIDFADGINSYGTPEHQWMVENATTFGWYLPSWAQANGSRPEPWHWEYTVTRSQYGSSDSLVTGTDDEN